VHSDSVSLSTFITSNMESPSIEPRDTDYHETATMTESGEPPPHPREAPAGVATRAAPPTGIMTES